MNSNRIYHLKNCFVSGSTAVIYNWTVIENPNIDPAITFIYEAKPGNIIAEYDTVVATGHFRCNIFGHFIEDALSPLMEIPNDVIKKSKIITHAEQKYIDDFIPRLGLKEQFINLKQDEWVYARELYINFLPRVYMAHVGPCFRKLTKLVREKFGLLNAVPYKYVITNRAHYFRNIANFKEIVRAVKAEYPKVKWETHYQAEGKIEDTIKIYGFAKILFGPVGSNFFNSVFLHPTTICIVVYANVFDHTTPATIGCNFYRLILYCEPNVPQFEIVDNIFNVTRALLAFKVAFYVEEHNQWPDIPNGGLFI
ncbi:hypothetical protein TVAG_117670 [Trichomonas vaginalis G3]|uniref:Glycosyltransferase 61 catalytic domain-containing protein n=1 Tax=Trichomonas vaginalis (strain ATCC PRA-98 / G3) TaxID=412133 RepID=A2G8A9_TRIV3|nr:glycosyltransferase family [Trichomonas vaginalis G3]EAX86608.1 hypothetical protein TVAG_117670 [Trichomonas vaginalis G3]KAI5539898.1 glycosyltransferase family [Trichomonas vaginalis G3]|eukprot:XP_001299538.1 hypothetical protein [Trichomonas vaginalis G3]